MGRLGGLSSNVLRAASEDLKGLWLSLEQSSSL